MTPVGMIFLPLALLCSLTKPERLLGLLLLASVFEAASVFNSAIGSFLLGVPPFYVVEVLIAIRLAVLVIKQGELLPPKGDPRRRYAVPLLFFWGWACASAFILPFVFSGMPVYEPRGGIDEQYEALTALRWSFSNLAQVIYLTLNVATVFYAMHVIKTRKQVNTLLKALGIAAGIAIAAGALQRLALFQGWAFPYELLNNNPGYSQGFNQSAGEGYQRISSTFTEPSFAGSFLAAISIGMVAGFVRGRRTLLWLLATSAAFLVLLDTTATNGYVAFAVVLCCLFLYFSPLWGPKSARRFLAKGWLMLVAPLAGIGALVVTVFPSLTQAAFTLTAEKSDTLSFLHRVNADLTALGIFENTWGMGGGLGSNRPSSLVLAFLSTVGIVGTILFCIFLFKIAKGFPGKSAPSTIHWTAWSLAGLLVAQAVAVPDINRPALWGLIMLVVVQLDIPFRRTSPARALLAVRNPVPRPSLAPALTNPGNTVGA